MSDKKPKYILSKADKFSLIPLSIFFLIPGVITVFLYLSDNGAMIFTGAFAAFGLALTIYSIYCTCFVRILVFEDGFLYQPNIFTKKHYDYAEIAEAWDTQKRNPNGSTSWFFNFKTLDGQQFSFACPMNQTDGIDYMLEIINR